jgi:2-polyprenyl-3-methyl-5-hydroxy-6-metoxy-1,4-benzoquinol methylase
MESSAWSKFWKNQQRSFHEIMNVSTTFFANQIKNLFKLKPGDKILDYGCGPGFLSNCLTLDCGEITGADINVSYLNEARQNHPGELYIQITIDPVRNREILSEQLHQRRFDYIIVLSLTQYFSDVSDVRNLVNTLVLFLKENGKILIADVVDHKTSSIRDAIALFLHCVRIGKTIAFGKFIFYLLFSDYRKLTRDLDLLKITEAEITGFANSNSLVCKRIEGLTIHPSRNSYLLMRK